MRSSQKKIEASGPFLAAQDARTPARLLEDLRRWVSILPGLIEGTEESVRKLELARESDRLSSHRRLPKRLHTFPIDN